MSHSGTIRWLRECYRADRSRVGVRDFYGGDVKLRQMMRGEERLLTGLLEEELLTPSYGEKAFEYAAMYRREREVVYGALFVCGKRGGKVHRAPLVMYESGLEDGGGFVNLRVDAAAWRLNPAALLALDGGKEFEAKLLEVLRDGFLNEGVVGEIRRLLGEYCSGLNCDSLLKWPYLEKSKDVDEAGGGEVCVMAASGVGNVARSVAARGILDELELMGKISRGGYSGAFEAIFESDDAGKGSDGDHCLMVPTTLSDAQERVLKSARRNALTVCHGPPGTGKSFTIAAIALDHAARGESVLVASRGDHAVDVMHGKIDKMLEGEEATVRAGRKEYLRDLKGYLELCLMGHTVQGVDWVNQGVRRQELWRKIREVEKAEKEIEVEFGKSISRGKTMAEPNGGWVNRLQRLWIERSVKRRPLLCEMSELLSVLHGEREALVRDYGKLERRCRLWMALQNKDQAKELKQLLAGLRKYRGSDQEAIFKEMEFGVVLKVFPIWLSRFEDVHRVLPLTKELFDVAIIDEASQCDLASVLPILQRAKRVVVAGDTKQLRHVSFLAIQKMMDEARDAGVSEELLERLNYRDRSLMDVAADRVSSMDQTGLLDEHFRSERAIIGFSNERFYRGVLKVMREKPWAKGFGALESVYVEGRRGDDGVNLLEIEAVLNRLDKIVSAQRYLRPEERAKLGVLSPFRAQVDAMTDAVRERFSKNALARLLGDHDLLIGTAHRFQGEERDVMLISWCVDGESGAQVLRFLEREDVFNVSITRARIKQIVMHSVAAKQLAVGSLLGDYLRYAEVCEGSGVTDKEVCTDEFARQVAGGLSQSGVKVMLEGVVAGMEVDMVLEKNGEILGVDLVGYPGQMTKAVAQRKAQMLGRAGMKLVPLGYAEWVSRREECLERILKILQEEKG